MVYFNTFCVCASVPFYNEEWLAFFRSLKGSKYNTMLRHIAVDAGSSQQFTHFLAPLCKQQRKIIHQSAVAEIASSGKLFASQMIHKPGPRRSLRTGTHQKGFRLQVLIHVFTAQPPGIILGKPTLKTTQIICLYRKIRYLCKIHIFWSPKLLFPNCSQLFLIEVPFCLICY